MDNIDENVKIEEETIGNILVLRILGSLTALTCLTAERIIFKAVQKSDKKLILNFKDTVYLSSAGMRLLLQTKEKTNNKSGQLILCGMSERVFKALSLSGVNRFFDILPSEEDALLSFKDL